MRTHYATHVARRIARPLRAVAAPVLLVVLAMLAAACGSSLQEPHGGMQAPGQARTSGVEAIEVSAGVVVPELGSDEPLADPCYGGDAQHGVCAIEGVSPRPNGEELGETPIAAAISADGRDVAYSTRGPGRGDSVEDERVYLLDRATDTTTLLFVGGAYSLDLTPDGRFLVFLSEYDQLVPGDTNGLNDVFVYDGASGSLARVSVSSSGAQGVGAHSETTRVSISDDGRFVVFLSRASNLVPGDTNGSSGVFVAAVPW